jgi:hypothetical protein
LFGFLSSWYLIRVLSRRIPVLKWVFYYSFCLFPSIVFWSSGLLKESVISVLLALISVFILKVYKKRFISIISILGLSIVLLWIKYYILAAIIPAIVFLVIYELKFSKWIKLSFTVVFILSFFFSLQFLHPWLEPGKLPQTIYNNYQQILNSTGKSFTGLALEPTYASLYKNAVFGLFTSLYRPFLWEDIGILSWAYRLENLALLLLSIISLIYIRKTRVDKYAQAIIIFSFAMALILSFTTPNFGTLYRYKSSFLPYFVMIISIIPYRKYLSQSI